MIFCMAKQLEGPGQPGSICFGISINAVVVIVECLPQRGDLHPEAGVCTFSSFMSLE